MELVYGYGAFVPQETTESISYDTLNDLIELSGKYVQEKYSGINEGNWRTYIPEDELRCAEESRLPSPVILDKSLQAADVAESSILEVFCLMNQIYGGSAVYFRRVGNDYRAFYARTTESRSSVRIKPDELSEAFIDKIMEGKEYIGPTNKYDRLLSPLEAAYIINELYADYRDDGEKWQAAGTVIQKRGYIKTKNVTEELSGVTNYFYRVMSAIEYMAERGGV
ncbi:MAG: hypothetical protein J1F63_03820 [Oscillospiraceae bacterium]|nr:hypothetical protein [Oscillospiraceae bacterium]